MAAATLLRAKRRRGQNRHAADAVGRVPGEAGRALHSPTCGEGRRGGAAVPTPTAVGSARARRRGGAETQRGPRRCRPPGATCPARQPRPGPPGRSEFKAPRGDEPRFPPHSHGPAGAAPRRLCRRLSPPLARRPRAVAARGSAAGPGAVVRPTPGRLPPACPVPGRAGVRMTPLPNGAGALPGRSISI